MCLSALALLLFDPLHLTRFGPPKAVAHGVHLRIGTPPR